MCVEETWQEGVPSERDGSRRGASRSRARLPQTMSYWGERRAQTFNPCLFTRTNLLAPPERMNCFRTALGVCLIK